MAERAPGAIDLDLLLEGGATDDAMIQYKSDTTQLLQEGGASSEAINEYWGTPKPDTSGIFKWSEDVIDEFLDETIGEDVEGQRPDIGDTLLKGFRAGAQESVGGLILRGELPTVKAPDSILGTAVAGTTTVLADLPIMIGAGIGGAIAGLAGGPAAPITVPAAAAGAAFAVPAGLRAALIDGYKNGSYTSIGDFLERTVQVYFETAKAFVTGAATGTAGALAKPGLQALAAEITALTTVQQGLEGNIPTFRDFIDTASILVGLKVATKLGTKAVGLEDARREKNVEKVVRETLETIYVKTGKQPKEVLEDAMIDPSIMEDILSRNVEIPRAYKELVAEAPEVVSVMGKGESQGTVVEGKLPPNVEKTYSELSEKTQNIQPLVNEYTKLNPGATASILRDARDLLNRMTDNVTNGSASQSAIKTKVARILTTLKSEGFQPGGGDSLGIDIRLNARKRGLDKVEESEVASQLRQQITEADTKAKVLDERLAAGEKGTVRAEKNSLNEQLKGLRTSLKEETGSKVLVKPGKEFEKAVGQLLTNYANESKKLPVYNEAQWLAREISVAIGEARYEDAIKHLDDLNTIVNDGAYTQRALEYQNGKDGKLVEFVRDPETGEKVEPIQKFDVEKQKPQEEEVAVEEPQKTPEQLEAEETAKERGPKKEEEVFDLETAQGRILDRISTGATGKKINVKQTLHNIYEQAFDALHPLKRLVDVLSDGKEIPAGSDPYKLARVSVASASRSEMSLTKEQRNFAGKIVGPSLSDILSPLKNNSVETEGLRAYLVAKTQLVRKDEKTKIDLEDAKIVVKSGNKKYSNMTKMLLTYQSNLSQLLVDSGRSSPVMKKKLESLNEDFIPWHILTDEKVPTQLGKVIDPLESIVKNTYTYNHLAIQNHVGRSLIEMAEKRPDLIEGVMTKITIDEKSQQKARKELEPIVKSIKDQYGIKFTPDELLIFRTERRQVKKDQEFAVYRDGKREIWSLPPDVARVFNSLDRSTVGLLVNLLALPAKTLRAGAILNPEFTGRNVFRDTIFAAISSKSGFVPGWDTVVGLSTIFKDGKIYRDWLFSGGAQATIVAMDRTYISQNLKEVLNKTNVRSSVRNLIMDEGRNTVSSRFSPIEALRVLSELGENATRLGEFKRSQAKLKKTNASEFDANTEAAFRAREVTDFARMGSKMQGVNMLVAFLNAKLQGEDRAVRAFIDKPAKSLFIATATITLPTVLLWWNNKDDPRYLALPQWMKDLFWIILTDDTMYRVPKAHTLGLIFGSIPERILNELYADGPEAFKDLGKAFGLDQVGALIPQAFIPFIEEATNFSLNRNRPLIGSAGEKLVPELRSTPYTTELTKAIGRVMAEIPGMRLSNYTSPIVIDNFVRQWSGGLGTYTMEILDKAARTAGIIPDPIKPTTPFEQLPFVKAFTIRHPLASTSHSDEFYSRYKEKSQIYASFKQLAEEGDFESAKRILAIDPSAMVELTEMRQVINDMRTLVRVIPQLPITPDEMRQQIDKALSAITAIAKAGNDIMDQMEDALEGSFNDTPKAIIDPSAIPSTIPSQDELPQAITDPNITADISQKTEPKLPNINLVQTKKNLNTPNVINDQLIASDDLIQSIIKQESSGNAQTISRRPDGTPVAYGLMQITLPTARNPGFGLEGLKGTDAQIIKQLLNPKLNKQFGIQYINALLHKYGGNVFHALLAYHSGPGFVDNWIKAGSNPNKMGPQGQNYVEKVSNNYRVRTQ